MKIKIAARKSDLARLQAYRVADALREKNPNIEIEFTFRESLGDKNLETPLWKIPERGVFTEDFVEDLRAGRADLVVHSWKDLPTEPRENLEIIATLPRADCRDLLLVHKNFQGKKLKILTSSPRRAYSLQKFLPPLLPFELSEIECESVRGNIPTRLQKLARGDGHGLMVAKAALDRLLDAPEEEFRETQKEIRQVLAQMNWMVLPLTYFPTAPAQGAIAIEARSDRTDLREILSSIHCHSTFSAVNLERKKFSAFGGGCHQKIGLSILPHKRFGHLEFFSGELDSGEQCHSLLPARSPQKKIRQRWPEIPTALFERHELDVNNPGGPLYIARAEALPAKWKINQLVWCAGLETWKKLAQRKIWVNGSSEGLGEELPEINALCEGPLRWTKLTHSRSKNVDFFTSYATYELKEKQLDIPMAEEFFWMSETAFDRAVSLRPEIWQAQHAAGPGFTAQALEKKLGRAVDVYVNFKHWKTGSAI